MRTRAVVVMPVPLTSGRGQGTAGDERKVRHGGRRFDSDRLFSFISARGGNCFIAVTGRPFCRQNPLRQLPLTGSAIPVPIEFRQIAGHGRAACCSCPCCAPPCSFWGRTPAVSAQASAAAAH